MKFDQLIKVLLYNDTVQYKLVWKSLTVFCESLLTHILAFSNILFSAVIAIALLFATFVYSVIVLRNFGRGLKDACMCPFSSTTLS